MIAIISLLLVIFLSILITRIATIALMHTGLTRESAKFQARSAFSGAGFTTTESEMVVNHPVRRRIVMILILIGNAGIVAAMSSLILTFVRQGDSTSLPLKIVMLVAGVFLLWAFASSQWVDRRLSILIDRLLKRYTRLDVTDYASLLHLTGDYRLAELRVRKGDWLAEKRLADAQLRKEGVNVLGVRRADGTYLGTPFGETLIQPGDALVLYGRIGSIGQLDRRNKGLHGDQEHEEAVEEQEEVVQQEAAQDTEISEEDVSPRL